MFFNGPVKKSDLGLVSNVEIKRIVIRLMGNLIKLVFLQLRILW